MTQILTSKAHEETIQGSDGLKLFMRSWRPVTNARAVVAIVPGFNSHSGYYGWTAEQLTSNGLAVYAIDLRERGQSDGERFYMNHFSDYVADVGSMMTQIASRDPGLPVFLLGHSAGGVVGCTYALEHQAELAGFICEDFAFEVPAPDFALAVLKGLGHVAPHAHVFKLKNADFSRDDAIVAAMDSDALIAHEAQPTQTMAEMVRADERLKKGFPELKLPVLILHGTMDKVTKPSGSQHFYDTTGSADKTLKFYAGSYHDPLNDIDKETVITDIKTWIDTRLSRA